MNHSNMKIKRLAWTLMALLLPAMSALADGPFRQHRVIATLLPIDKIIGKVYPLFAFSLLFMAGALMIGLFVKWPTLPELWRGALVPSAKTASSIRPS